jgi:hypothetical protein
MQIGLDDLFHIPDSAQMIRVVIRICTAALLGGILGWSVSAQARPRDCARTCSSQAASHCRCLRVGDSVALPSFGQSNDDGS